MTSKTVELRCPVGPQRLLSKLILAGTRPPIVGGNLVELACTDCKRALRAKGEPVVRVLHRYSLDGSLIESVVVT